MLDPIRTPELEAYVVATVALAAAAPGALSGVVWSWLRLRPERFLPVHVAVMGATALLSTLVLPVDRPAHGPLALAALALGLGGLVFLVAVGADLLVRARVRSRGGWVSASLPSGGVALPPRGGAPAVAGRRTTVGAWLLAAAALEEVLYRGVLLQLAILLPGLVPSVAAVAATVVVFAAAHATFGWGNAATMLALGAAATAATLLAGTVAPAVVGHVLFNARAARGPR